MDEVVGAEIGALELSGEWFGAFFAAHRPGMVRLAFVLVDDVHVAEDVVQTAFARVYRHRNQLTNPEAYLRSAVYNGCRNHHRWAAVRRRRPLRPERDELAPVADHVIDVIRRLPQRQRAVVVLRYYADLNDREIAEVMGIPIGTVKSTLHRTLSRLRTELS